MQWRMLQQNFPKDYVIATGEQHSVREFIELSASVLNLKIIWSGKGLMKLERFLTLTELR